MGCQAFRQEYNPNNNVLGKHSVYKEYTPVKVELIHETLENAVPLGVAFTIYTLVILI